MGLNFWQVLKKRHCVRDFLPKPVEKSKIKKLLQAATSAPSAGNIQDWRFIIIQKSNLKSQISEAALGQSFVEEAPVVIVVCSDLDEIEEVYGQRGRELYSIQDTAAAIENLLLAVTAEGLGACWVGAFDEQRIAEVLDLPDNWRPMAIIPIGHPAQKPEDHGRKNLGKVVKWINKKDKNERNFSRSIT